MPKTNALAWPICTVGECRHSIEHHDPDALLEFVEAHRTDTLALVNRRTGQAVCICHSPPVAALRETSRFACDQRRR